MLPRSWHEGSLVWWVWCEDPKSQSGTGGQVSPGGEGTALWVSKQLSSHRAGAGVGARDFPLPVISAGCAARTGRKESPPVDPQSPLTKRNQSSPGISAMKVPEGKADESAGAVANALCAA